MQFSKVILRQVAKLRQSSAVPSVRLSKFSPRARLSRLSVEARLSRLSRLSHLSKLSRLSTGFSACRSFHSRPSLVHVPGTKGSTSSRVCNTLSHTNHSIRNHSNNCCSSSTCNKHASHSKSTSNCTSSRSNLNSASFPVAHNHSHKFSTSPSSSSSPPPDREELYAKLLLETYEDPLKKDFDSRMHRHYGSDSAIKLSAGDQNLLMPQDNLCVVLTQLETLKYFDLEKPSIIEPWEVLLETTNVGVCGSDYEWYKSGKIGPIQLKQPMIMGHETGARVKALGAAAQDEGRLKVGDIVALEPGLVCGECDACRGQQYNLCPSVTFFATPPVHGTMRRYMKHHYKYCFPVAGASSDNTAGRLGPDVVNEFGEIAALCEPLSVGIHAGGPNVAQVKAGDFVGVFGAGPIGIINLLCSIYYGARKVFITDVVDTKLDIVRKYVNENKDVLAGVQVECINTAKTPLNKEYLASLFAVQTGTVDHAFDCVGHERVLNNCLELTKPGGMTTVIGMAANLEMKIDVASFNVYEKTLNGVFRYRYTYPEGIRMLLSGKVGDVRSLITSRLDPFDEKQLEEGFQTISKNMKIMFQF